MKLIKCASMYHIALPGAAALTQHLQELPFKEVDPSSMGSAGFVKVPATGELVAPLVNGLAFALRYDQKILPANVVQSETRKRIEQIEQNQYRRVGEKEAREIKDMVSGELRGKALIRSAILICYYHTDTKTLVVPTSNQNIAKTATTLLVRAVGSITSQTIHVSNVKGGLTTRLQAYVDGDFSAFDEFEMGNDVWLQSDSGRVAIQSSRIDSATSAIKEALTRHAQVTAVQLTHSDTTFRLTDDFKLKSISFNYQPEPSGAVDAADAWKHEAAIQLLHVSNTIQALCRLFPYKDDLFKKAA